jgi:hypothetical protein
MAQNGAARIAARYYGFKPDTVVPLHFMGEMEELRHGTKICEFWNGPTGDRIYHFHEAYEQDENARVAVGRPQWGPKDKFDPGFVFISVRSFAQPWFSVLVNSCFALFSGSVFYLENGSTPQGRNRRGQQFSDIPVELEPLHAQLRAMNGQSHHVRAVAFLDVPDRFMCKLSLGFGALFLHPSFQDSAAAATLRAALWSRSAEAREKFKIPGAKFLGDRDPLRQLVEFPDCHILAGIPVGNRFMLLFRLAAGESHCMEVSHDPSHWAGTQAASGLIFIIAAGLRACVGPISQMDAITDYISATNPALTPHPQLAALRARIAALPPRPPI